MEPENKLFDQEYLEKVSKKYSGLSRWSWTAGAVYVLSTKAKNEREILECIYREYPKCQHKKEIKSRILSLDSDQFWGGWSELRVYDSFVSRGFKVELEPVLRGGKPDFLIGYPTGKTSYKELICEVTTISDESDLNKKEERKIKQLVTTLDKVVETTNYVLWLYIPPYYQPLPSQINYRELQKSLKAQLEKFQFQQGTKTEFICKNGNIKIGVRILITLQKKKGYIAGYLPGGFKSEKDLEERIYDRIRKKIRKYKSLKDMGMPFIVAIFIKGPFFIDTFDNAFYKMTKIKKVLGKDIRENKRLSGVLLYQIIGHLENNGTYTINLEHIFYPHPNPLHPVDESFKALIDPILGIDEAMILKAKIEKGEVKLQI